MDEKTLHLVRQYAHAALIGFIMGEVQKPEGAKMRDMADAAIRMGVEMVESERALMPEIKKRLEPGSS